MNVQGIEVQKGSWLAANCGKYPSDRNCQLVLMAPESQRADLLDAVVAHAVTSHGHENTPELRQELDKFLERVEV